MKGCSAGTFFRKSSASSAVHISAPTATSITLWKPTWRMASRIWEEVTFSPNWLTKAGATAATTLSPRLMAWISWKIWLLSEIAPKGQFTRHIPQETHLS